MSLFISPFLFFKFICLMPLRYDRPTGGSHERLWVAPRDVLRDTIPQHTMQYDTITFQNYLTHDIIRSNITTFNAFNTLNTINTHPAIHHHQSCLRAGHSPLDSSYDLFLAITAIQLRSHIIYNSRTLLFLPLSTDAFRHLHLHFCFATITWSAYMIILPQIAGNNSIFFSNEKLAQTFFFWLCSPICLSAARMQHRIALHWKIA